MSRMMQLEPAPSYRGVVLRVYSHRAGNYYANKQPSTYTASDGTVYQYHMATVHGPFATRGRAKAAITRYAIGRDVNGKVQSISVAEEYTFIEESSADWTVSQ